MAKRVTDINFGSAGIAIDQAFSFTVAFMTGYLASVRAKLIEMKANTKQERLYKDPAGFTTVTTLYNNLKPSRTVTVQIRYKSTTSSVTDISYITYDGYIPLKAIDNNYDKFTEMTITADA